MTALLGVDTGHILKCLHTISLYSLRQGHEWRVAAFHFHNGREIRGLAQVLPALSPDLPLMELTGWRRRKMISASLAKR